MSAYFSSKFSKQIYAALTALLLSLCVLGTNWIGFSHSISHAHLQSQVEVNSSCNESLPSLNHSSDVCHLFDALTLAGFIASKPITGLTFIGIEYQPNTLIASLIAQLSFEHYQSRAPPGFLL